MIDLSAEIQAFEEAVYGKDVRAAMVNGAEKIQNEVNDAIEHQLLEVDDTLTIEGAGADAKATGERIAEVKADLSGISSLPKLPRIIGSDGIWTDVSTTHISVEMEGGETVVITAKQSISAVCAFLKSDNAAHNTAADFCSGSAWETRKVVAAGGTTTFIAPSDCRVLYFAVFSNNHDLFPEKVVINGEDVTLNLKEATIENTEAIYALDTKMTAVESAVFDVQSTLDITGLRKTLKGEYTQVTLPAYTHLSDYDLPLFTDGYKYVHAIDLSAYKNNSTNTVTVHNNTELQTALTNATAGDTIILDGGLYESIVVNKSINLIGKNNPLFVNKLPGVFTATTDETGKTFKTVADIDYSVTMTLDITHLADGLVIPMTQAASISALIATPGTFIVSGNKLYVHMYDGKMPTERDIAVLGTDAYTINLSGASAACKWYLEGLTVFGGKSCIFAKDSEDYDAQTVIGVDCKAFYSQTGDCIAMRGVDGFFQRCETTGGYLDGFNYHKRNPSASSDHNISNGFEVDCNAHDNGNRDTGSHPDGVSNNGSTIHDGGKIVRINGLYYNNNGGNVADASPNTESYNYGCIAFDSKASYDTTDETSADFWVEYAHMYLYGCRALGDSQYNLRTFSSGTIYVDSKSEYDTNKKKGNIENI